MRLSLRSSSPTINSVAILPFVNDSKDPNAEYLSDGITESIINSLSQLPNLKVMSRNAAFRFKGSNLDPVEAGRNLNVGAVLTGRLVKLDDRLVIKTELIKVADGSQLWGAEYNSSLADIFSVQDEVSKKISQSLRLRLSGEDEEKLAKRYTKDAEAYQLYLKGPILLEQAQRRRFSQRHRVLQTRRREGSDFRARVFRARRFIRAALRHRRGEAGRRNAESEGRGAESCRCRSDVGRSLHFARVCADWRTTGTGSARRAIFSRRSS